MRGKRRNFAALKARRLVAATRIGRFGWVRIGRMVEELTRIIWNRTMAMHAIVVAKTTNTIPVVISMHFLVSLLDARRGYAGRDWMELNSPQNLLVES